MLWLCLCSYRTLHHSAQGPHLPDQHPLSAGAGETHTRVGGGQLEVGQSPDAEGYTETSVSAHQGCGYFYLLEFPLDCRDDESATAELNELLYS